MKLNKKILSIVFFITIILLVGCSKKEDNIIEPSNMNIVEGKVTEIKDDNTVVLSIVKDRGDCKKGEEVVVKYESATSYDYHNDPDATIDSDENYKVQLNDVVSVSYWGTDDLEIVDNVKHISATKLEININQPDASSY